MFSFLKFQANTFEDVFISIIYNCKYCFLALFVFVVKYKKLFGPKRFFNWEYYANT